MARIAREHLFFPRERMGSETNLLAILLDVSAHQR